MRTKDTTFTLILTKEFRIYIKSKNMLLTWLLPLLIFCALMMVVVLTRGYCVTPQSRALAYKQLKASCGLLGMTARDIEVMGLDMAIAVAVLIVQLPFVVVITGYIVAYNAIVHSFALERLEGMMEALLAAPVKESEVVGAKVLAAILCSLLSIAALDLEILGTIEYVFLSSAHRLWAPTQLFLVLAVILPLAFMVVGVPVGILISVKARDVSSTMWGNLLSVLPLALLLAAFALSLELLLLASLIAALVSFFASAFLVAYAKRFLRRDYLVVPPR